MHRENCHTSMMSGSTSWLSVMRVTTVSVKVLFVIVSVTRPGPVGAGGKSMGSGLQMVTVTACWTGGSGLGELLCRKWAGIMAWNSSFVMGLGSTWLSSPSSELVGVTFACGCGGSPLGGLAVFAVGGFGAGSGGGCWLSRLGAGCGTVSSFGVQSTPFSFGSGWDCGSLIWKLKNANSIISPNKNATENATCALVY